MAGVFETAAWVVRVGAAIWVMAALGVGWWFGWLPGLIALGIAVPLAVFLWKAAAFIAGQ